MTTEREEVDVVIVGAGAAGGVFAHTLASAGKRAVILEAGPPWRRSDLISSQIWARRLKWGGASVEGIGANRYGHNAIHGWGSGGAALHHYGTWPRMYPEVFRYQSSYGVGHDWPLSYTDLLPWYNRVQEEVGISGDRAQEPWRQPQDPAYPMPPLTATAQANVLAQGFHLLGKQTAPLPVIINSQPYKGRPACQYDGWCDAGCPIGALGNPLENYLGGALKLGAELRNHCTVTRVTVDKFGRASGVDYFKQGEKHRLRATVVVLAGSVVQNPRILLNSATADFPSGLANSSGLVGKYLDIEVMASAFGLFEEETHPYLGVNSGTLTYRETSRENHREKPFGGYQWQIGPAAKPNDIFGIAATRPDLFGKPLQDFIRTANLHLAQMVGFGSTWSSKENRVELAKSTDHTGMPSARVVHSFSKESLQLWQYLSAEGLAVMKRAGAYESWTGAVLTGHTVGGTIMGADPIYSVTDSYGCSHDIHNLFLAGGGIMPASGGSSPTYTIHALSLRAAERLVSHWHEYANGVSAV